MSENPTIRLINHASFLLEDGNNVMLSDTWCKKPAFGSLNPLMPYHPALMPSLSYSDRINFCIFISHGHDDHCDDDLSLFDKDTPIIIHDYKSKGFAKRIEANIFILEL